jgi:iron complex outermembrane receptor protein
VQLPDIEDLGGLQDMIPTPGKPIVLTGIPTLAPTIVSNYEVGWDRELLGLDATLRVGVFVQNTDGAVSNIGASSSLPTALLVTPAPLGNSDAEGLELEVKGRIGPSWRWGLSYTPEIVTDHFISNSITQLFVVDFQHTTPTHVVNANLGWSAGPWEVDGYLRYESAFYGLTPEGTSPSLIRIDDYVSIDGRVAYRIADWATLALSSQNLGQSSQHQTAGPAVARRVVGSLSARF